MLLNTYNWVCQAVDLALTVHDRWIDSVADDRSPADDEDGDDKKQSDRDVTLLGVQLIDINRRTIAHPASIRTDCSPDSEWTDNNDDNWNSVTRDNRQYEVGVGRWTVRVFRRTLSRVRIVVHLENRTKGRLPFILKIRSWGVIVFFLFIRIFTQTN